MQKINKLGRITQVELSLGGRYDSELGLLVTMGAAQYNGQPDSAWSVTSFDGVRHNYMRGDEELVAYLVNYLGHILQKAEVTKLSDLVSKPVICEFEQGELISWRLWDKTV
jgi:hypothetical protein